MLADASGRSGTARNQLILKHPEKSRSARFSLGADGRRFDPGRHPHVARTRFVICAVGSPAGGSPVGSTAGLITTRGFGPAA